MEAPSAAFPKTKILLIGTKVRDRPLTMRVPFQANLVDIQNAILDELNVPVVQQQLFFNQAPLLSNDNDAVLDLKDKSELFLSIIGRSDNQNKEEGEQQVMVCVVDGNTGDEQVMSVSPEMHVSDLKHHYMSRFKRKMEKMGVIKVSDVDFIYMGRILQDHQQLSFFEVGKQKVSYIFLAFKSEKNPLAKAMRTSQALREYALRLSYKTLEGHGSESYLVVPRTATAEQIKLLYIQNLKASVGSSPSTPSTKSQVIEELSSYNFSLCLFGQSLESDARVADFASDQLTSLEVVPEHRSILQVASCQEIVEQYESRRESPNFQQALVEARDTQHDRDETGLDRFKSYHAIQKLQKELISDDSIVASKLTANVLQQKPTGKVESDLSTAVHLIHNLLGQNGEEVTFFDSRKGMKLMDSSMFIQDLCLPDKPMIFRLESLDGMDSVHSMLSSKTATSTVELQAAVDTNTNHPILEEVISKLARSFNVPNDRIRINNVFNGSVCFDFTVSDLAPREREEILQQDTTGRLHREFQGFLDLRVHPLLYRPAFDLALFDPRGNKSFVKLNSTFKVGPTGMQKTYKQPHGWVRYGLLALTGNAIQDKWLHPFQDPGNFHGTANAGKYMTGVRSGIPQQMCNAAVNAMADIHRGGFQAAHRASYGPGVYCSPDPTWLEESGYVATIPLDLEGTAKPKKFKMMLQVAVRPGSDSLQPQSTDKIWAVKNTEWIKSYGILFKEVEES